MHINKYDVYSMIYFIIIPVYIIACWKLFEYSRDQYNKQTGFPIWLYWFLVSLVTVTALMMLSLILTSHDSYSLLSSGQRVVNNKTLNAMCPQYVAQHPLKPSVNDYLINHKLA
jgi:hypothetical protein